MIFKVLTVAILFCYQAFCNNLVSEDSALLQQALKSLLKLKQLPAKSGPQNPNPNYGDLATPPQYMLDLYLQYKNGGKSNLKRRGNTVRSFLPTFGNINGEDMLLFNVSAIHSSEDILFAELHIFKRKMKSRRLQTANFEIQFYEIATSHIPKLGTLDTRPNSNGWQAYDITKVVTRSRQIGNDQHLIGMRIVAVKDNSRISVMSPRKFLRDAAKPFLIVFSNDNETVNLDHLDGPLWTKDQLKKPLIQSNGNEPSPSIPSINVSDVEMDEKIQRNPESVYHLNLETSVNDVIKEDINTTKDKAKRVSRSLLDNELPEYPSYSNHIPQTSPGILRGRNKYRQRNDPNIIPYPDKLGRDGKRRKNRRNRKQRNRQLPSIWQQPQRHENDATLEIPDEEKINLCQQRSLIVDFAKIGWSEWIISPRTFEAHYCSGKCPFPLTKNMRPSNHATIQSIVHAIGLNTDVPPPCCVPDVLSSVTLLYYDEDRNVVLKNYPSMTVESCACR